MGVLSEAVPRLTSLPGPAPFARRCECTVRGCISLPGTAPFTTVSWGPVRGCTPADLSPALLHSPGVMNVLSEAVSLSLVLLHLPGVLSVLSEAVPGLTSLPGPALFASCRGCNIRGCTRAERAPWSHSFHHGVVNVLSEAVPWLTSLPGPAPFIRCRECTVRGYTRALPSLPSLLRSRGVVDRLTRVCGHALTRLC